MRCTTKIRSKHKKEGFNSFPAVVTAQRIFSSYTNFISQCKKKLWGKMKNLTKSKKKVKTCLSPEILSTSECFLGGYFQVKNNAELFSFLRFSFIVFIVSKRMIYLSTLLALKNVCENKIEKVRRITKKGQIYWREREKNTIWRRTCVPGVNCSIFWRTISTSSSGPGNW